MLSACLNETKIITDTQKRARSYLNVNRHTTQYKWYKLIQTKNINYLWCVYAFGGKSKRINNMHAYTETIHVYWNFVCVPRPKWISSENENSHNYEEKRIYLNRYHRLLCLLRILKFFFNFAIQNCFDSLSLSRTRIFFILTKSIVFSISSISLELLLLYDYGYSLLPVGNIYRKFYK